MHPIHRWRTHIYETVHGVFIYDMTALRLSKRNAVPRVVTNLLMMYRLA